MADRYLGLCRVFRGKKKKSPEAAPAQQHENPEQFQPLEDDAPLDCTEEKEPARGHDRKTLKTFWKSPRIRRRKTGSAAAEGPAEPDSGLTELQAEPDVSPDSPECSENSDTSVTETWTKVLLPSVTEDVAITNTDSEETPGITNTATSLDPAEPSEDSEAARNDQRANADMALTEDVDMTNAKTRHTQGIANTDTMPTPSPTLSQDLIFDYFKDPCVSSQPLQVSSLGPGLEASQDRVSSQAMVSGPPQPLRPAQWGRREVPAKVKYIHQSLMSQVTVDAWQGAASQSAHILSRDAGERPDLCESLLGGVWPSHLMAFFPPARELCHVLVPFCSRTAFCLLRPHSRAEPCWDLPVLAFLVEVLGCLDLRECGDSLLEIMSRHLWSECRERRRLALRGLVVLTKDPSMARRMHPLSPRLLELLGDANAEVVSMSLCVFTNVLQHKGILVSSTTTPKLAEALLLLFDHDSSNVHLISIQLFDKMMHLVVDEGKKPLKKILCQSLLPLFLYCHEENRRVAKASRETLLGVAEFLKKRNLRKLLKNEQLSQFAECLVRRAGRPQPQPGEAP
uniref:uncharacterized protein n=1 Tax=Lonchura striata TaxID=40157 RepID=UPI001292F4E6|nr:protein MROH8 [Lonchura striata domestica]